MLSFHLFVTQQVDMVAIGDTGSVIDRDWAHLFFFSRYQGRRIKSTVNFTRGAVADALAEWQARARYFGIITLPLCSNVTGASSRLNAYALLLDDLIAGGAPPRQSVQMPRLTLAALADAAHALRNLQVSGGLLRGQGMPQVA